MNRLLTKQTVSNRVITYLPDNEPRRWPGYLLLALLWGANIYLIINHILHDRQ